MWVKQSLASWRPGGAWTQGKAHWLRALHLIRGGQRPSAVERVTAWFLGSWRPPPASFSGDLGPGRASRGHGPLLLGQLGSGVIVAGWRTQGASLPCVSYLSSRMWGRLTTSTAQVVETQGCLTSAVQKGRNT